MRRIPTLDGWRGVAILLVIACHLGIIFGVKPLWHLGIGVDLFFAISGFLITSSLLHDSHLGRFYVRRAFRILPVVLIFLAVIESLGLFTRRFELASSLFFWRNYLPGSQSGLFTDHFWSLSIEEQFYLVWPIILVALARRRAESLLKWTILALNLWRLACIAQGASATAFRHTDLRADGLLWGCLIALWVARDGIRLSKAFWVIALVSICLIIAILRPILLAFVPVCMVALVVGTVERPQWLPSRLLEWEPLVWVGKRSYGLYVWQQLFIFAGVSPPLWLRLIALFVFADLSYRIMEVPLQNMGRRIARQIAAAPKAAPAVQSCPVVSQTD